MILLLWYSLAAAGEIAGCYSFWAWLRLGRHPLWTLPGVIALVIFGLALTRIDTPAAGRGYAAYEGIYTFFRPVVLGCGKNAARSMGHDRRCDLRFGRHRHPVR